jgi:hypothetical protein
MIAWPFAHAPPAPVNTNMSTAALQLQCASSAATTTRHRSIARGGKTKPLRRCVQVKANGGDRARDENENNAAPHQSSSRRSALGSLLATPLILPSILSSSAAAVLSAASVGPASAAELELEAEVTSKVFFDFAVDAQPVGRVVVGVFGKANPVGAARFESLAKGVQGLSYKRTVGGLLRKLNPVESR